MRFSTVIHGSRWLATAAALALLAPACSVDSADPNTNPNAMGPDAGVAANECLTPADQGALGALAGSGSSGPASENPANTIYRFSADLDANTPKDSLSILAYEGRGVFAAGATPGTYDLTGAEADFQTCGACVTVVADIVPGRGGTKFFIAQSGTITYDTITPTISGSLSNVQLQEFDVLSEALVPGGCQTSITSATFAVAQ